MRIALSLRLLAIPLTLCSNVLRPRDYDAHDYYAVELAASAAPQEVAKHLGLELEGPLGEIEHHYLYRSTRNEGHDVVNSARLRRRKRSNGWEDTLDSVVWSQKQKLKPRMWKRGVIPTDIQSDGHTVRSTLSAQKERPKDAAVERQDKIAKSLDILDPIFKEQWHLYNTQDSEHSLNVTDVWMQGITGQNVTACIVDDGLDMDSEDLKANYFAGGSYDFNDKGDDPKPRLSDDRHGTRCAGEVAAAKNSVCGVGVAWDARISGIRILSKVISDTDEALAMNYAMQDNHIYSCSWGPPDDGVAMDAPGILIRKAMVNAIQKGRSGKGSIYVFAAGNGAAKDDNCNFDGYTNSIYSVTVGAIDRKGLHPYYSEKCSAQLVVTYSSGSGDAIHTTDVGRDKCYSGHGGTSAAGPLAVGIYALVLQARPDLTWRDIQWLTVMTAVPVHEESEWQETAIKGRKFSHQYGYGKLDAWAIVEASKNYKLVKPQAWFYSPWMHIRHPIPQGDKGLASIFEVTADALKEANLERVEHVTITMNVNHTRRGDLSVELRSPFGVVSHLSTDRKHDDTAAGYSDWTFMSVAHWGETGIGNWTIIVKDTHVNDKNGTFIDWKLRLFGECIDPNTQDVFPLPGEHDDDDHDRVDAEPVHTSIEIPTTTEHPPHPTDHPERPVNSKPTDNPTTTNTEPIPTDIASSPTAASPTATSTSYPVSFLPSPFPTFGVSKSTQVWIYGSLILILIFILSLSLYFYLARRKRLKGERSGRDTYEFEVLDDQAEIPLAGGRGGGGDGGAGKRGRRAGELYDAFARESDDGMGEDEEIFSDGDGGYRDESGDEEDGFHKEGKGREGNER